MQSPRSDWDFLAMQQTPVLRIGDGLLLMDDGFLVDRMTSGMYWVVHDYLKATEGETARIHWTQAWGDMVEALAEEDLRQLAPVVLAGNPPYYTEQDLAAAYPGHKTADLVIDFGTGLAVFEVVSGQLSTSTRIDGLRESFFSDLEKLAFK
jgi:hypothetical protein